MTQDERRVLLVEDNSDLAESMTFALSVFGWSVVGPVASSAEANAAIQEERFDAAILDVDLDDGRSFPVAAELRKRGLPFLFLTGFAVEQDLPPELAQVPRLEKPVPPEALVEALEALTSGGALP